MELDTTPNADQQSAEPVEDVGVDSGGLFSNMFTPAPMENVSPAVDKELTHFPDVTPAVEKQAGADVPNKEKPDRFEYWQREADLRKREKELLEQELNSRKQFDPVLEFIRKDPEAYQYLERRIAGAKAEQDTGPKPPTPPDKPASFNEQEAYTAPDSPSWKYRTELDRYREARMDYLERVNEVREQSVRQAMEQRAQAEKQTQQLQEIRAEVMRVHNFSPERADLFMQRMTDPESLTLRNIVRLFELLESEGQTKQGGQNVPPPPTGVASRPRPTGDVAQAFNASMSTWDEGRMQRMRQQRSK